MQPWYKQNITTTTQTFELFTLERIFWVKCYFTDNINYQGK